MSQAGLVNSTGVPLLPTDFAADAGAATPAGNVLNVVGAGDILTSGAGNTLTITGPQIFTKEITLTAAEVKNLHGTPLLFIPAAGANTVIVILNGSSKLVYGGTSPFVAALGQDIDLYYGAAKSIDQNGHGIAPSFMVTKSQTAYSVFGSYFTSIDDANVGAVDNQNIMLYNENATEISGNAANDNSIVISVCYYVADLN